MPNLKINEAPLLPNLTGIERIPTGGRGDYSTSVDQIKEFVKADVQATIDTEVAQLEATDAELLSLIEALANGATKAYLTFAALDAAKTTLPANSFANVTNDPNTALNGLYQWDGTTLTKSSYDPLNAAKAYVDASRLFNPVTLTVGTDFNTITAEGRTVVPTNEIAEACTNQPSATAGVLDVALIGGSGVFQVYRVFQFDLAYERQRLSGGTWTDWVQSASKDMVDTTAANTLLSAQNYANANPLFAPAVLTTGADLNALATGYSTIPSDSVAATLIGLPAGLTAPRRGMVFTYRSGLVSYQKIVSGNSTVNESFERTGNGLAFDNPSFAWNPWIRVVDSTVLDARDVARQAILDANPLFTPVDLALSADLNALATGIYYARTAEVAASLVDAPVGTAPMAGTYIVYRRTAIAYQRFIRFNTLDVWERVGNGGSTSFAFNPWVKVVSRDEYTTNNTAVAASIALKPDLNLFANLNLTSAGASLYQATQAEESGLPTLTMDTTILSSVFYEHVLDNKYFRIGATVTFSTEIFSDATGSSSGDITIQALSAAGAVLATSTTVRGSIANAWHTLTATLVLPASTATIRTRFIRRTGNTVVKFRRAKLVSNTVYGNTVQPASDVVAGSQMIFVSKTGSDTGTGKIDAPYLTISKALTAATTDNIVIEVGGGDYRETLTIAKAGSVWLRSKRGERARVFGSDQLAVTKTSGFSQIYQAPLPAKPVGMGAPRGLPVIFEWGTPSKPISADDVHFLQRGRSHRLPYTEMFEAATKAELDTVGGRGKWFWEAGTIFFAATDGGDATAKRYEARVRPVLVQLLGSIRLTRIDGYFSNNVGMDFQGIHTRREDCRVFGSYHDGFSDDANFTESYRDESAGNGNDGFNGTVTVTAGKADEETRVEAVYFDPYGHDNGDDGISFHVRGDSTIHGGLFEYNTKADVVHVTGACCVCYNTVAQGTTNGFYTATAAPDARTQTTFLCVNTKARKNQYSYRAGENTSLTVDGGISENPTVFGFQQGGTSVLTARNCLYTGDAPKAKSGTVTVINNPMLT